jgi:hypothetical protein
VSDNLIIVIAAVLFFFWYRMQQAMAAALCTGGGVSSGCGPSGLILGGQKIVVPGFGTACACQGRGVSSIFSCSPVRQGPIASPIGPARRVPPATSYMPVGMAPQATMLPGPIIIRPTPIFNSPQALATPTPALCQYKALETTSPTKLIASGFTTGSIPVVGPLINNLTECFCKVNALYGKALQQGIASGKICKCYAVVKKGCIKPCGRASGAFGPRASSGAL